MGAVILPLAAPCFDPAPPVGPERCLFISAPIPIMANAHNPADGVFFQQTGYMEHRPVEPFHERDHQDRSRHRFFHQYMQVVLGTGYGEIPVVIDGRGD